MSLLYSRPLNYQQKLQNVMVHYVMVWGWILGMMSFKWSAKTGRYVIGSKISQKLRILPISLTIITSIYSVYTFKKNILGNFIDTEIDIILNVMIVVQFFMCVILICLVFYLKQSAVLNIFNQVVYLKRIVLKLNKNPLLDSKLSGLFLRRWISGGIIITYISVITSQASKTIPLEPRYIFLVVSGFCVHYIWYTAAVSSLMCCMVFAAHLVRVITIEIKDILAKLKRINSIIDEIKRGQYINELNELSERIDYLKFCYYEVINFIQTMVSVAERPLLLITFNIFMSIITDTGNLYMRAFRKTYTEKNILEMKIFFGYLWFALNELYFLYYGPQKLLKRVMKLEKVVVSASMVVGKGDNRINKSVS